MRRKQTSRRRISNYMRVFRAMRGLSQTDVANYLDHGSKYRVWQWENSVTFPNDKERRKLAKLFGCKEGDLFPRIAA